MAENQVFDATVASAGRGPVGGSEQAEYLDEALAGSAEVVDGLIAAHSVMMPEH